jgi:hypothetical protein
MVTPGIRVGRRDASDSGIIPPMASSYPSWKFTRSEECSPLKAGSLSVMRVANQSEELPRHGTGLIPAVLEAESCRPSDLSSLRQRLPPGRDSLRFGGMTTVNPDPRPNVTRFCGSH